MFFFCFHCFVNDSATTEIYSLSLHDALPICQLLDVYGDVALNAPDTGFGSRHDALLAELVSVVRSVFGRRVVKEPRDHRSYNAGRPATAPTSTSLTVHWTVGTSSES